MTLGCFTPRAVSRRTVKGTRAQLIAFLVALFACVPLEAAGPKKIFDVVLQDVPGAGRVLNVSFYGRVPSATSVDRIVKECLQHAVLIDPSTDILAMGFHGDDGLSSNQYSGELVYVAKQKKIVTFDEFRGVKKTGAQTGSYFVETEEQKTFAGITPERKWLSITIVFPKQPSRAAAYDAITAEVEKAIGRRLDVLAYVSIGDSKVKTSWNQMKDTDGAYVFADYEVATGKLSRKDKLLKQFK